MRNGGRLSGMMPPGLCRSGRPVASCDSLRSPQALACRAPSVCREFRNPAPESELRHDPQAAATLTIRLLLLLLLAAAAGTIAGWRHRASL